MNEKNEWALLCGLPVADDADGAAGAAGAVGGVGGDAALNVF